MPEEQGRTTTVVTVRKRDGTGVQYQGILDMYYDEFLCGFEVLENEHHMIPMQDIEEIVVVVKPVS